MVMIRLDELRHYDVKGMKWGVRRYKDANGNWTLRKGTTVGRVSMNPNDPTYDNKKYVSVTKGDHKKWQKELAEGYARRGYRTWDVGYKTTKDLKIMSSAEQGKKFVEMVKNDPEFRARAPVDSLYADRFLGVGRSDDQAELISRNIAAQTQTGKRFVQELLKEGYGGVEDTHGKNVSKDPVIIFDPDTNLRRTRSTETRASVEEMIRRRRLAY